RARPAGGSRDVRAGHRRAASERRAAVHGLAAVGARPDRARQGAVPELAAQRRAAAAGRRQGERPQAAVPDRLAGLRRQPAGLRPRVGQADRHALMAVLAGASAPPARRLWARGPSVQGLVSLLVLLVCGALVLYPVVFLAEESLNVGDAQAFPPTEIGLDNYTDLL